MRIVIIEDERLTAKDLARTIRIVEPDADILPILYTIEDAKDFFEQSPAVDLIFSDIELGDGLSLDFFETLQLKIPIIFCTAYEAYTLKAFQSFGIDYIVKPFSKLQVEKALLKYKELEATFAVQAPDYARLAQSLKGGSNNSPKSILVHQGDKIIPVDVKQVELFYIENDKVHAFLNPKVQYILSEKLEALQERFPYFFRANRQFLIRRRAVKDVSHYFNRKLLVNLQFSFDFPIVVSRLKANAFLEWLATESFD